MIRAIGSNTRALALAALATLAPSLAWAEQGAELGATEVIGYATADRSGATTSWILADDAPYLFVPALGAEVAGAVAAVETGADVGAVLFQRPYFETRDAGCAPELGSDARPDLRWRGATARFSPPVEPETSAEPIASLIIYRKDVGPPPGVLLLNRRLTLGTACSKAVHKTFFSRVFIPLAAPPAPARCYNLSGTYSRDGGADIKVNFAFADRLALLQPADFDDRYRGQRHRFRAVLFDDEGCRGRGGEFRSAGQEPGNIKLDPIGLRDRVRSVRIVYEGGPLAAYYVVPAPVATAPVAKAPAAETPVAEAPVPQSAAPTPTPIPAPAPTPAPAPVAAPAQVSTLAPIPEKRPENRGEPATVRPRTTAISLSVALPAPRLKIAPAQPAAPAPAATSRTFEYPVHDIYRLNFCLNFDANCGEPAATAWCRAQGFAKAGAWRIDKDIGSLFPTIALANSQVCAQGQCDGFEEITCINEDRAPQPVRQTTTNG